ncbi:MAG TPA: sulfite exporter TauE/SafE family protein [Chloroflexota bacterium]|nr:sulfite exporter TauE/SafE family protein [Chloroflexota bacterium]HUM69410.1 sulfite exporter TauE/SafE family protein [Chloroflexota bacterium]
MPPEFLVAVIVFAAVFVQAATGFGLALVSMPLLTAVLGLPIAAPLMSIVGLVVEFILLVHFREAVNLRAVRGLVLAAFIGTPVGLYLLRVVDPAMGARVLGLIVAAYAAYALVSPYLPRLAHPRWAWLFGFTAGVIGGLYNTSGPPVIIYGSCRRWPPAEFKGNLQGFFLPTGLLVLVGHLLEGNITPIVWHNGWLALPGAAVGLFMGGILGERLPAAAFRKVVLFLLLLIGLRLLLF